MNKAAMSVSIFLLLGVAYMVTCNGCSGAGKYKKYSSTDPELNITMDYISGWQYRETRGSNNSYADVFFGEPRNKWEKKVLKAFMSVTSVETPRGGTLETLADGLSGNKLKYEGGKLLNRARIKIPAGEAIKLNFSYKALNKIYSIDSKLIPVEEEVVILINGGRFYTIRYENKEDDFNRFNKDFDHIIKSIRFKQKK